MAQWFYLNEANAPTGPLHHSELHAALAKRPDRAEVLVVQEGSQEWLPYKEAFPAQCVKAVGASVPSPKSHPAAQGFQPVSSEFTAPAVAQIMNIVSLFLILAGVVLLVLSRISVFPPVEREFYWLTACAAFGVGAVWQAIVKVVVNTARTAWAVEKAAQEQQILLYKMATSLEVIANQSRK